MVRDRPWDIHALLSLNGIRSPGLSVLDVRTLILQHKQEFTNMNRGDMGQYLSHPQVHNELVLSNQMIESSVKAMMFVLACDSPIIPNWNNFSEETNSYLAHLCAMTLIMSEEPLRDLPREFTGEERRDIIQTAVDIIFTEASTVLHQWRRSTTRNHRNDSTRRSSPITIPTPGRALGFGRSPSPRRRVRRPSSSIDSREGRSTSTSRARWDRTPSPLSSPGRSDDSGDNDPMGVFGANREPRRNFRRN